MRVGLAIVLALLSLPARADQLKRVKDGDGLAWHGKRDDRLAHIDAPEFRQMCGEVPCGRISGKVLAKMIGKREVECTAVDYDAKYHRDVSVCHVGRTNLNERMVARGWAFAYWPFRDKQLNRLPCPNDRLPDCHRTTQDTMDLEDEARAAGKGFWGLPVKPVYPACFRHPERCPTD